MKKNLALFAFILILGKISFSQVAGFVPGGIPAPVFHPASDLSYSNYKSYQPYLMVSGNSSNASANGVLQGSDYNLKIGTLEKKGNDADFKILFNVQSLISKFSMAKDSGFLNLTYAINTIIYDKKGAVAFEKQSNGTVNSSIPGVNSNETLRDKSIDLKRLALTEVLNTVIAEFSQKYFGAEQIIPAQFMTFGFSFKKNEALELENEGHNILNGGAASRNQQRFLDSVKKAMPVWQKLTAITEGKKHENANLLGYHNLAISYLLLNDTALAKENFDKAAAITPYVRYFTRLIDVMKEQLSDCSRPPVVVTPIHDASLVSTVNIEDIKDNVAFVVIKGSAVAADGTTKSGTFKIRKPEVKGESGLLDLDRADYDVVFVGADGSTIQTQLSKYASFSDLDGNFFLVMKSQGGMLGKNTFEIHKAIIKTQKLVAYQVVFPSASTAYSYMKPGEKKLFFPKFLRETKSTAEYFSDCPTLSEKIKNDSVSYKDAETIVAEYSNCK